VVKVAGAITVRVGAEGITTGQMGAGSIAAVVICLVGRGTMGVVTQRLIGTTLKRKGKMGIGVGTGKKGWSEVRRREAGEGRMKLLLLLLVARKTSRSGGAGVPAAAAVGPAAAAAAAARRRRLAAAAVVTAAAVAAAAAPRTLLIVAGVASASSSSSSAA
jgi:hypothetical protein